MKDMLPKQNTSGPFIIAYHKVRKMDIDPHLLSVTPEYFDLQMELISGLLRPTSLGDLLSNLYACESTDGMVAVTFDDGYRDNLVNALPILEKYGIPATVFVSSDYTLSPRKYYWDSLLPLIFVPSQWDKFDELGIPQNIAGSKPPFENALHRYLFLCKAIKNMPRIAADSLTRFADGLYDQGELSDIDNTMSQTELCELSRSGSVEIGSHGVYHQRFTMLGEKDQIAEMMCSKKTLERILKTKIRYFCYPYGGAKDINRQSAKYVQNAGYDAGFTCINEKLGPDVSRRFLLPRRIARNWDQKQFYKWITDASAAEKMEAKLLSRRIDRTLEEVSRMMPL